MEITEATTLRVTAERNFQRAVALLKAAKATYNHVDKTWTVDPADLPMVRRLRGQPKVPQVEPLRAVEAGIDEDWFEVSG